MNRSRILVRAAHGDVSGVKHDGFETYFGLPFAGAPLGEHRFAPPPPVVDRSGVLDASGFGAVSLQDVDLLSEVIPATSASFFPAGAGFSEDCLTLNVWTPGAHGKAPVLVWIHGGGWSTGSGAASWSDGARLAREHGIVVVSINYRLGVLGWLATEYTDDPAAIGLNNAGMFDQIAALEWVRDNIEQFGGDPGRVTVAGESAGAFSVAILAGLPRASELFRGAVVQSGHTALVAMPDEARHATHELLRILRIEPGSGALAALRAADPLAILAARRRMTARLLPPVVDGSTIELHPLDAIADGRSDGVRIVLGITADEARSFRALPARGTMSLVDFDEECRSQGLDPRELAALYGSPSSPAESEAQWDLLATDRLWRAPLTAVADARASRGVPTWSYEFRWSTDVLGGSRGAHQSDIPFVFDNLDSAGAEEVLGVGASRSAEELARRMAGAWTSFVHDGVPEVPDAPAWPMYTSSARRTYIFDREPRVELDLRRAQIEFWNARRA